MKFKNLIVLTIFAVPISANLAEQRVTINVGDFEGINLMRSIASADRAGDPRVTEYRSKLHAYRNQEIKEDDEYEVICRTSVDIDAEIYPLDPDNLHPKIAWAEAPLKEMFTDVPYPGECYEFMHPDGFRLVKIDYAELPSPVKQWITENPDQNSIAVVDGVAFFAPGVILYLRGLFAGAGEGACKGTLPAPRSALYVACMHNADSHARNQASFLLTPRRILRKSAMM